MKKILILTSVYPDTDLETNDTKVVHYFAKEWVNMGYQVKVVTNSVYYPKIVHFTFKVFKSILSKMYNFPFSTIQISKPKKYECDNVEIFRLPIFKLFPFFLISKKVINKQCEKIKGILINSEFNPDVIIGHWPNPQLVLIKKLSDSYNAKTCLVIHNNVKIISRILNRYKDISLNNIDIFGYRSLEIKNRFENQFGLQNRSFLCYSGVPGNNKESFAKQFDNGVNKFLFVGHLIPRKNPFTVLESINKVFKNYQLSFIGTGPESSKILRFSKTNNLGGNVKVMGRKTRNEVFTEMDKSDCFILVSRPETLGLVYIEAMSRGCITIGSLKEGIDGIIKHGVNGFLCLPGDSCALSNVLKEISVLTKSELQFISHNAIKTAEELTDYNAAKSYITNIQSL